MTPEEAIPRTLWDYENKFGDESGDEAMFAVQAFTAKETAEIAHAYAHTIVVESWTWVSADQDKHEAARAVLTAWRDKFEEWSK